jgi:hypothetical protein
MQVWVARNTSIITMGMPQWRGQSPQKRQNFKKNSPEKILFSLRIMSSIRGINTNSVRFAPAYRKKLFLKQYHHLISDIQGVTYGPPAPDNQ